MAHSCKHTFRSPSKGLQPHHGPRCLGKVRAPPLPTHMSCTHRLQEDQSRRTVTADGPPLSHAVLHASAHVWAVPTTALKKSRCSALNLLPMALTALSLALLLVAHTYHWSSACECVCRVGGA